MARLTQIEILGHNLGIPIEWLFEMFDSHWKSKDLVQAMRKRYGKNIFGFRCSSDGLEGEIVADAIAAEESAIDMSVFSSILRKHLDQVTASPDPDNKPSRLLDTTSALSQQH